MRTHLPVLFHLATVVFHLVTMLFQLVTRYFTFPVRFLLNSNFSHTFLNGQLTRRAHCSYLTHVSSRYCHVIPHVKFELLTYSARRATTLAWLMVVGDTPLAATSSILSHILCRAKYGRIKSYWWIILDPHLETISCKIPSAPTKGNISINNYNK